MRGEGNSHSGVFEDRLKSLDLSLLKEKKNYKTIIKENNSNFNILIENKR